MTTALKLLERDIERLANDYIYYVGVGPFYLYIGSKEKAILLESDKLFIERFGRVAYRMEGMPPLIIKIIQDEKFLDVGHKSLPF
jgi:hypothetical protein